MDEFRRRLMTMNQEADDDLSKIPLYIEALEDSTYVKFTTNTIQYSLDNSTWVDMSTSESTPYINAGERIYFRASGLKASSSNGIGTFSVYGSKKFNVGGNTMSMLYGGDFIGQETLNSYSFIKLFNGCAYLVDASKLILPATTLASSCYHKMFYDCSRLTAAPELPATILNSYCYEEMFYNCRALTTAPVLPAISLRSYCYDSMFNGCSKLAYIKAMFTTKPSSSSTGSWVSGVASKGVFVKNKDATWNVSGIHGIPSGWTIETA